MDRREKFYWIKKLTNHLRTYDVIAAATQTDPPLNNGRTPDIWMSVIDQVLKKDRNDGFVKMLETVNDYLDGKPFTKDIKELKEEGEKQRVILKNAIDKQNCVVILGPKVLQCKVETNGAEDRYEPFNKFAAGKLYGKELENRAYYVDTSQVDNLAYIAHCLNKATGGKDSIQTQKVKEYFEHAKNEGVLKIDNIKAIARKKIKYVINCNADELFLEQEGILRDDYCVGYCNLSNNSENKGELKYVEGKGIYYNIFGSFDCPPSMILSDEDFNRFIKTVFQNTAALPFPVKNLLSGDYLILMVGFDFNQWYAKIIMNIICDVQGDNDRMSYSHIIDETKLYEKEFYEDAYRIKFIDSAILNAVINN